MEMVEGRKNTGQKETNSWKTNWEVLEAESIPWEMAIMRQQVFCGYGKLRGRVMYNSELEISLWNTKTTAIIIP